MSFGNAKRERRALETTYEDTATFAHQMDVSRGNADDQAPGEPYAVDVICALSSETDSSKQTGGPMTLDYNATIFCAPELPVLPGDVVAVKRFGRDDPDSARVYTFTVVGVPAVYATHQQVNGVVEELS